VSSDNSARSLGVSDHPLGATVEVVRYPEEAERLQDLRVHRIPRLILVEGSVDPPWPPEVGEDWARLPVGDRDLQRRIDALSYTGPAALEEPGLDSEGLLWFRGRWVACSPAEDRLLPLLVERFNHVVSTADLAEADTGAGGGPADPTRVRSLVLRLRRRLEPLGLSILTVRSHGYLLTGMRDAPDHAVGAPESARRREPTDPVPGRS
jgi:DNA-binding winged helix-turn-helix (wHTH) protein